jgi:hypothetical protein
LNCSKRVTVLPDVFFQRRRDFVGVPVAAGEKSDDHVLARTASEVYVMGR